ncbi:MAG: HAD family hydrolase [Verrucomicrobia bacterium]|nr:HAD family hydrolase [Verrucomicrobiota bacterium]
MPVPPADVAKLFATFDGSTAAYQSLSRTLDAATAEWPELRVAVLSTCTAEVLQPFLVVEGARRGLRLKPWFGPFGQIEQQVLDPRSALFAFKPDIVWVFARLEDWAERELLQFAALEDAARAELRDSIIKRITAVTEAARRNTSASLLWCNFAPPRLPGVMSAPGLCDGRSLTAFCNALNEEMSRAIALVAGAWTFDLARTISQCGASRWTDSRMALLARIPFSTDGAIALSRALTRVLRAVLMPPRKCLVLDLDNTLWGGVVGEVGAAGIKLGDSFPGNAYVALQKAALALRNRGVVLAVASKNNEAEALEALAHPDGILRPGDFAAMEIHWEDKATSLRRIASKLNIGTDALAFFDDSATEREWVRAQMPEVGVIEVPASPADYGAALEDSEMFDAPLITVDDLRRAEMYQQQEQRRALQQTSGSVDDFLMSLDMKVQVGPVNTETMERVAQLIAKTNQFNLTTRRYTHAELSSMIDAGAVALWMRVTDRFGDNGLTGAIIALPEDDTGLWRVDTLVLSCRIIGRNIETGLLGVLCSEVAKRGAHTLKGEYLPTAKNELVKDFYPRHKFAADDSDGRLWRRSLLPLDSFTIPSYLHLTYAE